MPKNKLKILASILIVIAVVFIYNSTPPLSGQTYFERGEKSFKIGISTDVVDDSIFEDAIDNYEKAIDKGITKRAVFSNLVTSYLFFNRDDRNAKRTLNKAIEIYPNDAEFYFDRGNCEKELKNYKKAFLDYDKCVKLGETKNEDYIKDAIYRRGAMRYLLGDFANAAKDLKLAQSKTDHELRTYDDYCQLFK
ncbi:tetratricopeptide (TPR) repeat protein [Flavobacterium nitrogenifigens]|uniref:Tetratricopeptide (TPR) repeat protein n=2 Tax=Flavobacterium TaxID=237 RepID=A0A7W7IZK1_9FLAO|nr:MULTISPECIES: tetratricopeptide repeat protein [Flavobacterium]MBB4803067.1 tetratricopeptide (TPR) repeat protein [Flavobacterium nitrogenifigens]MBB6388025.1 tetratricopeptide (TPR) repeat protein [Flavobacterium notoginsengisoli]